VKKKVIPNNIAKIRKEKGLSQKELAEKLQIGNEWLCHIENGSRIPSLNLINNICKVLGVKKSEIFLD